jgi:hypothetical protein
LGRALWRGGRKEDQEGGGSDSATSVRASTWCGGSTRDPKG